MNIKSTTHKSMNNTPEQRKLAAEKAAKLAIRELSEFLKANGISRKQIAEATGLGQGNMTPIFSGKRIPKLDTLLLVWVAAQDLAKKRLERPSFIRGITANNAKQIPIPTKAT